MLHSFELLIEMEIALTYNAVIPNYLFHRDLKMSSRYFSWLLFLVVVSTQATTRASVIYSVSNYNAIEGDSNLSNFVIDVNVRTDGIDTGKQIISAQIAFAISELGKDPTVDNLNVLVLEPPTNFSGTWSNTVWATNPNVAFQATDLPTKKNHDATTTIVNGNLLTGGLSGVVANGVLVQYIADFSALGEGTYTLTANNGNLSTVIFENDFSSPTVFSSTNGSLTIHPSAVPEPSTFALLAVGCGFVSYRRLRRIARKPSV